MAQVRLAPVEPLTKAGRHAPRRPKRTREPDRKISVKARPVMPPEGGGWATQKTDR